MDNNESQSHAEEEGCQELGKEESLQSRDRGSENERIRQEWKKTGRSIC